MKNIKMFLWLAHYQFSRLLVNTGLIIMPKSCYKTELLEAMWKIRFRMVAEIEIYKEQEEAARRRKHQPIKRAKFWEWCVAKDKPVLIGEPCDCGHQEAKNEKSL